MRNFVFSCLHPHRSMTSRRNKLHSIECTLRACRGNNNSPISVLTTREDTECGIVCFFGRTRIDWNRRFASGAGLCNAAHALFFSLRKPIGLGSLVLTTRLLWWLRFDLFYGPHYPRAKQSHCAQGFQIYGTWMGTVCSLIHHVEIKDIHRRLAFGFRILGISLYEAEFYHTFCQHFPRSKWN